MLIPITVFAGLAKNEDTYVAELPPVTPVVDGVVVLPKPTHNDPKPTQNEPIYPLKTEVVEPIECSCVRYAEFLIPGILLIDAIDYPLNTITPKVGDIIKLQYYNEETTNYIYHIAVIKEITEEGYEIEEGNYNKCEKSERTILLDDDKILGFFNPARQALIDNLTPIQKETLWNESGWSMYDTNGSILFGMGDRDDGWGVIQMTPATWKWMTSLRRRDKVEPILLDKLNFEDQIIMFLYGWDKGVTWYGRPAL